MAQGFGDECSDEPETTDDEGDSSDEEGDSSDEDKVEEDRRERLREILDILSDNGLDAPDVDPDDLSDEEVEVMIDEATLRIEEDEEDFDDRDNLEHLVGLFESILAGENPSYEAYAQEEYKEVFDWVERCKKLDIKTLPIEEVRKEYEIGSRFLIELEEGDEDDEDELSFKIEQAERDYKDLINHPLVVSGFFKVSDTVQEFKEDLGGDSYDHLEEMSPEELNNLHEAIESDLDYLDQLQDDHDLKEREAEGRLEVAEELLEDLDEAIDGEDTTDFDKAVAVGAHEELEKVIESVRPVLEKEQSDIGPPSTDDLVKEVSEPLQEVVEKTIRKRKREPEENERSIREYRTMVKIATELRKTDLIISPQHFKNLAKEIMKDFNEDLDLDQEALEALQTAAEAFLIERFQKGNLNAIRCGRTHLQVGDMERYH